MSKKTVLLLGATGLIGGQVLEGLLEDPYFEMVTIITRRELPIENKKLKQLIGGFEELEAFTPHLSVDIVFCCLGTTMKKAGSKEQFFKIDYEYPLRVAQLSHGQGTQQYLLVSSMGADRHSKIYYNSVKGQIEVALAKLGFPSLHIFRPSLLFGPRDEARVGEDAAKSFFKLFNFLFIGSLKKYKAIDAGKVARAMIHEAKQEKAGLHYYESAKLQDF